MVVPHGEAHLWYASPAKIAPQHLATKLPWLSSGERERYGRFFKKRDAHEYLLTQVLARVVLAPYMSCAPEALRFHWDENGKPHVHPEHEIHFNLSNCPELVVCLVAPSAAGVDVEELARATEVSDVAASILSPAEQRALPNEPTRRSRRCLDIWTLKEAYLKAIGIGLGLPLDRITVDVDAQRLSFESPVADDPDQWQLGVQAVGLCLVATVIRDRSPVRVVVREAKP